ncbi:unnamed protein product [Prunus armeniaca]|uniref:Uncharacterized protein n=1 Tax=Prunus armeniaca TaxID=36596 RepID=A0A6J5WQC0_PRUAR|nr:unnamed protein product [Prunus armeniaca]
MFTPTQNLEVWSCESITEIVASNGDEEDSGNYYEIAFSSLRHLYLSGLPRGEAADCPYKLVLQDSIFHSFAPHQVLNTVPALAAIADLINVYCLIQACKRPPQGTG